MRSKNSVENKPLKSVRHIINYILYAAIFFLVLTCIFLALGFSDIIITIPLTLFLSLVTLSVIGFALESKQWLSAITYSIIDIIRNPSVLREFGVTKAGIKNNIMRMLKSGLSIESLDESFFNSVNNILIDKLLEPVKENETVSISLKLDNYNGEEYVIITQSREYNIINPTDNEADIFLEGIVNQIEAVIPEPFVDEEDVNDDVFYKCVEFDVREYELTEKEKEGKEDNRIESENNEGEEENNEQDNEVNTSDTQELDHKFEIKEGESGLKCYNACDYSSLKIEPHEKKRVCTIIRFIMNPTDFLLYGFKAITKGAICHIHYNPDELHVEAMLTSPIAYPIIYPTKKISDGLLTIQTNDVLYPGNCAVIFWNVKD